MHCNPSFDADNDDVMASVPSARVYRGRGAPRSPVPQVHPYSLPYPRPRYPQFPPYPHRHSQTVRRHSTTSSPLLSRRSRQHRRHFTIPKKAYVQRSSPTHPAPVQLPTPSVHNEFRNLLSLYHPPHHHPHLHRYDYLSLRWVSEWDSIISPSPSVLLQLGLPVPEVASPDIQTDRASSAGESSGLSSDSEEELKEGGIHAPSLHNQPLSEECEQESVLDSLGYSSFQEADIHAPRLYNEPQRVGSECGSSRHSSFKRLPVFSQLTEVHGQNIDEEEDNSFAGAFLESLELQSISDANDIDRVVLTSAEQQRTTGASSLTSSVCCPIGDDLREDQWTVMDFDDCVFEEPQHVVNNHPPSAMPRTAENSQDLLEASDQDLVSGQYTEVDKADRCIGLDSCASNNDCLATKSDSAKADEFTLGTDNTGVCQLSNAVTEYVHESETRDVSSSGALELKNRYPLEAKDVSGGASASELENMNPSVTEDVSGSSGSELENRPHPSVAEDVSSGSGASELENRYPSVEAPDHEGDLFREEQVMDIDEEDSVLSHTEETNTTNYLDDDCEDRSGDCSDMDDTEPERTRPFPERTRIDDKEPAMNTPPVPERTCVSQAPCTVTSSFHGCIMSTGCALHRPCTTQTATVTPANTDPATPVQESPVHASSVYNHGGQKYKICPDSPATDSLSNSKKSGEWFRVGVDNSCSDHDLGSVSQSSVETEQNNKHCDDEADFPTLQNNLASRDNESGHVDQHSKRVLSEEDQEPKTTKENICNTQNPLTQTSAHTSRPRLVCKRRGKPRKGKTDHNLQTSCSPDVSSASGVIEAPPVRYDVINNNCGEGKALDSGNSPGHNLDNSEVRDSSTVSCTEVDRRRATKRPFICTIDMDTIIRILQQCDLLE
ncbi:hypothetical protein ACOMHN_027633 [Nucella lapillus]